MTSSANAIALARPRRVLADLIPGALVRDAVLVVVAAALTGLCAQLSFHIPGTPVPVTGQTFAVVVSGAALGWWRGLLAMLLYLAAGVAGLPWFAHHASGYVGATFGYIVAFVVAAAVVGFIAGRGGDRTVLRTVGTMLLGSVIIYVIGAGWLAADLHLSAAQAFELGVRPFIPGDALKVLLAAGLLPAAWLLVGERGRDRGSRNDSRRA